MHDVIKIPLDLSASTHFSMYQGPELLDKAGGLHKFMNWDRALLTVS